MKETMCFLGFFERGYDENRLTAGKNRLKIFLLSSLKQSNVPKMQYPDHNTFI